MNATDFIIGGVGGQGALLASDVIAEVGISVGLDVKKSDVHGMAQRGGAVISHVRWGMGVNSPLVERGRVEARLAVGVDVDHLGLRPARAGETGERAAGEEAERGAAADRTVIHGGSLMHRSRRPTARWR